MKESNAPKPDNAAMEMTIQSHPSALCFVRQKTREIAGTIGFDPKEIDQIVLAMDEALSNVIRHGYCGACDRPIDIRMERKTLPGRQGLEVTIRDYGKQVDAKTINGRDLDDVRPGGLGVHIIRAVMDVAEYAPAEGGGMLLKMVKFLS
jgi:serine/threonine-protein kinase RsbW